MTITTTRGVTLLVPTRSCIADLKVGDSALDAFGRLARVTEITARRADVKGRLFVCYYTDVGGGSTCSMSMKEGELVRTVHTSAHHTSAELDRIERDMLAGREISL